MNSKQLEAKEFLETLYSRYFKDHDGNVELRLIGPKVSSRFFRKGEISDADWAAIVEANKDNHVYFGVNPRSLSQAKKQEDILDIVCLWADVDGKDFEGSKEKTLKAVDAFPIPPTMVVDSGHGYHLYWVLSEPIIGLTGVARAEFKRVLAGVAKRLGADSSKIHLDSCLRLPGTLNIKGDEPAECMILKQEKERTYSLGDFLEFKDADYKEPQADESLLTDFGAKTQSISIKDAEAAKTDVEKMEVPSKTKNLIITGEMLRTKGADKTRSGRDFSIICSLVYCEYDYATIKSIFFNPFLKCSNRIMEQGETALLHDVREALRRVERKHTKATPQSLEIEKIKGSALTADQKRKQIQAYIVEDLLTGPNSAGSGFKDPIFNVFYFYDKAEKMLMDLESTDFYCYMRARYDISKKDFDEIKDGVMTAIWDSDKKAVPRHFAYFDPKQLVLYVSDHDNGVYRLDGEKIELHENGVDGVYFEYDPTLVPFTYDPKLDVVDYFPTTTVPGRTVSAKGVKIRIPAQERSGFSLERFHQSNCLLKQFLIDRASFTEDEDNLLSPAEQRLFLILYFYSTFFESLMKEKPVACFEGLKASGKSFTATSIGKIFFGDSFESSGLPKSADDLAVILWKNHYLVIDNLDTYLKGDMLDMICSIATGREVKKRKLYKDATEIKFVPHCFLAITSRESKFKRDDLVDRLLLFNTKKVDSPVSRTELIKSLLEQRSAIMTEVLTNLNSIVRILLFEEARKLDNPDWQPIKCVSRLADWETFSRMVCGFNSGLYFRLAMPLMVHNKDEFATKEDYLRLVLHEICFTKEQAIEELTAAQLYAMLAHEAEAMYLSDFQKRYKNPVSMGLRLAHTKKELGRWFEIEICKQPNGQRLYSFKGIGVDIKAKTTAAEADKAATAWLREAKRGKKGGPGKKPQGAERDDEPVDD